MSRRALLAAFGLALLLPAAQAQHARPRYIALVADQLTKSGEAAESVVGEPELSWRKQRGAIVINGPSLTRATVARVLSDKRLRGRRVVLLLRGTTTAGPSHPPAWLVHSSLSGADALLDPARLISAPDIRQWLARSGAASTVLVVEGGDGVEALCEGLATNTGEKPRVVARCVRSGGPQAQSMAAWLAGMPADPSRVTRALAGSFE